MLQQDEELLDLELYYALYVQDRPQQEEATRTWLRHAWQQGDIEEKSSLKARLSLWLDAQKRQESIQGDSLGGELANAIFWVSCLLMLLGGGLGLLSMTSYLSPGGSINITGFIAQYMLFPMALSLLVLALFLSPSPTGLLPRPLRLLAAALIKAATRSLKRHSNAAWQEHCLRNIGQILASSKQYSQLLQWKLSRIMQGMFLCYFCGLLGSALFVLSSESKNFSWQTTLTQSITAERLQQVVNITSIGLSPLNQEDLVQSCESTSLSPQLKHQWGMYCLLIISLWGIAPRLLFWLYSSWKLRRIRRSYDFSDLYYAPLTRLLMAAPITGSDGRVQDLVEAPLRQTMRKACLLLSADCCPQRLPHAEESLSESLEHQYAIPINKRIQVQSLLQDEKQGWQQELRDYLAMLGDEEQMIFIAEDAQKSNASSSLKRWQKCLQEYGYKGERVYVGLLRQEINELQAEEVKDQWRGCVQKLASRQASSFLYHADGAFEPLNDSSESPLKGSGKSMLLVLSPDCNAKHMPQLNSNLCSLLMADGYAPLPTPIQQESLVHDPEQGWMNAAADQLDERSTINLICPIWLANTKGCIHKFIKLVRQELHYQGDIYFTALGTRPAGLPTQDAGLDLNLHKMHISNWQHSIQQAGDEHVQFLYYL